MSQSKRISLRWSGFAFVIALGTVACGESESKPPVAPAQTPMITSAPAQNFTFAPPPGTHFVRTERRSYEASIAGTPLARRDVRELRWGVDIMRAGDHYQIDQKLLHVMIEHNGQTVVNADVPSGAVQAQLVVDKSGSLMDVRGLEKTSETLLKLAGPEADESEKQLLSPQGLRAIVEMRYGVLTSDIIGHPATVGASWTAPGRAGMAVVSRSISVTKMETCGSATCARLRQDVTLAPTPILALADVMAKERVKVLGGDPSKVRAESASYTMSGTMAIDPKTMLAHDAQFDERGRVVVAGPKDKIEVDSKGTIQFTYEYGSAPVAAGER